MKFSLKTRVGLFILLASSALRFFYLASPNQVVFVEVHHGKFVDAYVATGNYFFDVHPPWGKLFPAAVLKLSGYTGGQSFEKIGNPYIQANAWAVRFFSCFTGSLTPLLVFLLLTELGTGVLAAFFGALVVIFDNGHILHSRLLLLYSPVFFWQVLCVWLGVLASRTQKNLYWALAGMAGGFAFGTQFTAFVAPLVVLAICFKKLTANWKAGILFSAMGAFVYTLGFWLHFKLLPHPGFGDAFKVRSGNFMTDFIALHEVMLKMGSTLTTAHPDMSSWYTWPLMLKPLYYWQGQTPMYFLGNPFVWTFGSALFLYFFITNPKAVRSAPIPASLFALSMAPFIFIPRILFLYHYMIPVLFLWMTLSNYLEQKGRFETMGKFEWGMILCLVLGFLWISPLTYAFSPPKFYWFFMPWNVYH